MTLGLFIIISSITISYVGSVFFLEKNTEQVISSTKTETLLSESTMSVFEVVPDPSQLPGDWTGVILFTVAVAATVVYLNPVLITPFLPYLGDCTRIALSVFYESDNRMPRIIESIPEPLIQTGVINDIPALPIIEHTHYFEVLSYSTTCLFGLLLLVLIGNYFFLDPKSESTVLLDQIPFDQVIPHGSRFASDPSRIITDLVGLVLLYSVMLGLNWVFAYFGSGRFYSDILYLYYTVFPPSS